MTNKTEELAKRIILLLEEELDGTFAYTRLTEQLARMVIEEREDIKDLEEIALTSCACKFKEVSREQIQECLLHKDQKEQARQEQKEKDAKVLLKHKNEDHDSITGLIAKKWAKEILEG